MSKSKRIFYMFINVIIPLIACRLIASEVYSLIPKEFTPILLFPMAVEVILYGSSIVFAIATAFSIASEDETNNDTASHEKVKRNDNTKWIKLK